MPEQTAEDKVLETLRIEVTKFALTQLGNNFQEVRKLLFMLQVLVISASPAILGLKRLDGLILSYSPLYIAWGLSLIGLGFLIHSFKRAGETYKSQVQSVFEVYGTSRDVDRAHELSSIATKEAEKTKFEIGAAGVCLVASLAFFALFLVLALSCGKEAPANVQANPQTQAPKA